MSLLKTFDLEQNVATRGFFLTAWNGKGGYSFDRIIRGSSHIDGVCLSMLGSTQPGRLSEYISKAIKGSGGDDGLIQRFSLLVWPDDTGEWKESDRAPKTAPRQAAYDTFRMLDEATPESVGAIREDFDKLPYLRLGEGAYAVFNEWRRGLEAKLRTGGLHNSVESHLSKYRKLVPSLALITHLSEGDTGPVSELAMLKATSFAEYLESHAKRAYGSGMHTEVATAKLILARIRRGDLKDDFTAREVQRHGWSNLTDADQLKEALALLDDLDWISSESKAGSTGRHKLSYKINPRGRQ